MARPCELFSQACSPAFTGHCPRDTRGVAQGLLPRAMRDESEHLKALPERPRLSWIEPQKRASRIRRLRCFNHFLVAWIFMSKA